MDLKAGWLLVPRRIQNGSSSQCNFFQLQGMKTLQLGQMFTFYLQDKYNLSHVIPQTSTPTHTSYKDWIVLKKTKQPARL